jgi:hypothetical protein
MVAEKAFYGVYLFWTAGIDSGAFPSNEGCLNPVSVFPPMMSPVFATTVRVQGTETTLTRTFHGSAIAVNRAHRV